ncbi:MAG: penicillin-insensitive murein endopeptidase [Thiohalocapsa sp.]|uniref:penicillin-insensitive murein endopeptidase n=1 Tax=Thiohalocapsa sp. TaxID=2497641 RepID=UPI0025F26A89|nr:penicillin-insensitive murein endopeptidase [Thiohalocapsa sp.]MCG6942025.1 penicillin-insensitive murein endopeptidase [Thiohalocapsa sp.]
MRLGPSLIVGLIVAGPAPLAGAAETPWSRVEHASLGKPTAIGGPSNGCIAGAQSLPATGTGFVSIRRHRNRFYGHPETIRLVKDLGKAMDTHNGRLIMIGDLSQPRGGRMNSSHVSHQNGLDVDVWLTLVDSPAGAVRAAPEGQDPPSMVTPDGLELSSRFGPDQLFLIRTAAAEPTVDRILVNPGIKRALCRMEHNAAWLRKLRPWWGHDAHMHVRLKCPPGSPHCQQQAPVPAGSGCGAELAWWFSPEARTPTASSSKPRARPRPPAQCQVLLRGS